MNAGGTKKSLRQAFGSFKDTATVTLAIVNSDYKELDIAIVRVTNHDERPAKECFLKDLFSCLSATRPRADVAYCIRALARRLSKTRNWAVALKTLVFIHRALREVDSTFAEELINYERSRIRTHMLNLAHFKDDSSPCAWDYSAWLRAYALYIEERLECFRVLKYDVETDRTRTKDLETAELLEHLPALQQLLNRALGCQPQGAAIGNFMIKSAFSMVVSESIKIYTALKDGTVNLVDKFFEMVRQDAIKALDIYRKAGNQAERLAEFYEICKSLDYARGERFVKIEQPPVSFIQAMEDYVKEAPRASATRKNQVAEKVILAIECKKTSEGPLESRQPSAPQSEPEQELKKVKAADDEPIDLLGLDDPVPNASELDEKNALAFAIVPVGGDQATAAGTTPANGTACWELAVVAAPASNENGNAASKLGGGLDKLNLDSLYDDAIRRSNKNMSYNSPWESTRMPTTPMMPQHDPFFGGNSMATTTPHSVPMMFQQHHPTAMMGPSQQQQQQHQQHRIMMMGAQQQQQHQMMMMGAQQQQNQMMMMNSQQQLQRQPLDHFGSSFGVGTHHHYGSGIPLQAYSSFNGRLGV